MLAEARVEHLSPVQQPHKAIKGRVRVSREDAVGFPVFTIRSQRMPVADTTLPDVLYLHGGGYAFDFAKQHWTFIARLVDRTGVSVIAPQYPLAPEHNWRDSFPQILNLARDHDRPLLLMGDSAGGGYALAIAQALAANGISPDAVLISPYGDATLADSETRRYARTDPWLAVDGALTCGRAWAGADDPASREISPLFGSFEGIRRLLILTGTRDLLHPQSRRIASRAAAAGVESELVVAPGSIHVYPLLPIPEAARALDDIVRFMHGPC